ncbi:MAG: sugar phosphate isomerase/epimerase, partial [Bryobacteraceae bacterium]
MLRRSFLQTVPGVAAAATMTAPPLAAGQVPIKLGFDTYSLRAFQWKAPQLLGYAASLKLDTIQISSLGDYESLDPAYLKHVKEQADRLGIQVDGGTGCICPSSHSYAKNGPPARDRVLQGLRVAATMGAK